MSAAYHNNPARRLRRIYRWLQRCGATPQCEEYYYKGTGIGTHSCELVGKCNELLGKEIEWVCGIASKQSDPTPDLDRAVIRSALRVMREWDEWDGDIGDSISLEESIESLRAALTAAGYLDGGSHG